MSGYGVETILGEKYFPERKIVLTVIEFEGEEDFAAEPVSIFSKHNVRMLSSVIQSHPDRGAVRASLFLDLTEASIGKEDLIHLLRSLPHVKRIEVVDIPFTHGEARLVAFTLKEIHDLFSMLRELDGAGIAIIYHMGFRAGEALARRLSDVFRDNRRKLEYLLLYYESLGHGRFRLKSYMEGTYCRVLAWELSECMGVKSGSPNSHLFRGLLAGFLSNIWEGEVQVLETRCIAIGDPYCEFEARKV